MVRGEQLRLGQRRRAGVFYQVNVFESEHISSVGTPPSKRQTVRRSNIPRVVRTDRLTHPER